MSELEEVPEPPTPIPAPPIPPPLESPAPVSASAAAPPSLWPSLLAPIVGLVGATIAGGAGIVVLALISRRDLLEHASEHRFEEWMKA